MTSILTLLTLATNNKLFYKSFAIKVNIEQNRNSKLAKDFIQAVSYLAVQSRCTPIAYAAANFLHKFTKYPGANPDLRAESLNKNLLVSQKCDINFAMDSFQLLGKLVLLSERDELPKIVKNHSLQISTLLSLYVNILFDRKDSTTPEDFVALFRWISSKLCFVILRFLCSFDSLGIVYNASILMTSVLQSSSNKEKIISYQTSVLNNSTLLLKHMEILMTPFSKKQKQISSVFLYHCLVENLRACSLMRRLMPKSLFKHVDSTSNDISKWTLIQWEQLFDILNEEFNTPSEQWNEECRQELLRRIIQAQETLDSKWKILDKRLLLAIVENVRASPEGKIPDDLSKKLVQTRWNHEEYEVYYRSLQKKMPVWKYYLVELFDEKEAPSLKARVVNPRHLWEELTIRFISSVNYPEKKRILEAMILLYQEHSEKIKEMTFIPYLLKILEDNNECEYHYLILQLLFTGLTVESLVLAHQNLSRFHDCKGLSVLRLHIIKSYFFENIDSTDYNQIRSSVLNEKEKLRRVPTDEHINSVEVYRAFDVVYNFSLANLVREAYSPLLQNSNRIVLCLMLIKTCLSQAKSQAEDLMLYPRPLARNVAMERETINMLHQLLLVKDENIRVAVHDLIKHAYLDKFSVTDFLQNSGFYERLLLHLTPSSSEIAATNLSCIFFILQEIHESKKTLFMEFAQFGYFEKKDAPVDEEPEDKDHDRPFDALYPLVDLLPQSLVYLLIKKGVAEFCKVYFSDNYSSPSLVWNEEMKNELKNQLLGILQIQYRNLENGFSKVGQAGKPGIRLYRVKEKDLRIFNLEKLQRIRIKYKSIDNELMAGPIYIRIWIRPEHNRFDIPEKFVPIMISELYKLLNRKASELEFEEDIEKLIFSHTIIRDLYIILNAHLKILSKFNVGYRNCIASLRFILHCWNVYVAGKPLLENSILEDKKELWSTIHLWDLAICKVYKIIYLSLKSKISDNFTDLQRETLLKSQMLTVPTKILLRYRNENKLSFTNLKMLVNFCKTLIALQEYEKNIVKFFADTQEEVGEFYEIGVLLNVLLQVYIDFFNQLKRNRFGQICAKNRMNNMEKISFTMKPTDGVDIGNKFQLDVTQSNIISYTESNMFNTLFHIKIEAKIQSFTDIAMEVISNISKEPELSNHMIDTGLAFRLLNMMELYIPKNIRYSPELQDADYLVRERLNSINSLAYKAMGALVTHSLQASIIHGISNLDIGLKDLKKEQFDELRDLGKAMKFKNPKNLEHFFQESIEILGEAVIFPLIKISFEPNSLYPFRDVLIGDDKNEPLISIENKSEYAKRAEQPIMLLSTNENARRGSNDSNDPYSYLTTLEAEIKINNIYLSAYVRNPVDIKFPGEFLEEATKRLEKYQLSSSSSLILILKAVICLLRNNPHLHLKEPIIQRFISLYTTIDPSWFQVKDKICEVLMAASVILRNENKEIEWIQWKSFQSLVVNIFKTVQVGLSKQVHQLLIKWNLIINQIIKTGVGNTAFKKNRLDIGIYRVIFDRNLSESLRKSYTNLVFDLGSFDPSVNDFIKRLLVVSNLHKEIDEIVSDDLVKLVEGSYYHPKVAFSPKVSRFISKKFEEQLSIIQASIESDTIDNKDIE